MRFYIIYILVQISFLGTALGHFSQCFFYFSFVGQLWWSTFLLSFPPLTPPCNFIKKEAPSQVFLKNTFGGCFWTCNKGTLRQVFSMNFLKLLKIPFLQNTYGRLLLTIQNFFICILNGVLNLVKRRIVSNILILNTQYFLWRKLEIQISVIYSESIRHCYPPLYQGKWINEQY